MNDCRAHIRGKKKNHGNIFTTFPGWLGGGSDEASITCRPHHSLTKRLPVLAQPGLERLVKAVEALRGPVAATLSRHLSFQQSPCTTGAARRRTGHEKEAEGGVVFRQAREQGRKGRDGHVQPLASGGARMCPEVSWSTSTLPERVGRALHRARGARLSGRGSGRR